MSDPTYRFPGERVEAAFRDAASTITEHDLEDAWDDVVDDGSEEAFVLTSEQLPITAAAVVDVGFGPDPRTTVSHAEARDRLHQHDGCADLLQEVVVQRDDAFDALLAARAAAVRTIFAQPDAEHVREQLDVIATMLGRQFPKVEQMLCEAADDITEFADFPVAHWKNVVDAAGRDALDVGLHRHRIERLIDPAARLEDHREERPAH